MVDSEDPTRRALELARSATPATARRRTALLAAVARPAAEVAGLLLVEVLRSPRGRAPAAAVLGRRRQAGIGASLTAAEPPPPPRKCHLAKDS
jgi:hypothetical protein